MKILAILIRLIFKFLFLGKKGQINTALENILLRQQINVLQRSVKRPQIKNRDRFILAIISKVYDQWRTALSIVQPDTVNGWHKKGFKLYWKWKSRKRGRPIIDWKLIKLIRKMQQENPLWSPQRIQGELAKLGITVCTNTVKKYFKKQTKDGDDLKRQNWITFLRNESKGAVGIDFCTVPTLCFKQLYVFIAIAHDRSKIIHFGFDETKIITRSRLIKITYSQKTRIIILCKNSNQKSFIAVTIYCLRQVPIHLYFLN